MGATDTGTVEDSSSYEFLLRIARPTDTSTGAPYNRPRPSTEVLYDICYVFNSVAI